MIISLTASSHSSPLPGGPTASELVKVLDQCDLINSRGSTPCVSPSPSMMLAPGFLQGLHFSRSKGIPPGMWSGSGSQSVDVTHPEGATADTRYQITRF